MDCRTIEPLLQGYLDGEVTSAEESEVLFHLKGCSSCQKELERSERVRKLFQMERELPSGFRSDLYTRIDQVHSPYPSRLLWAGGLATLLFLLFIPLLNRVFFSPAAEPNRIHIVSPARDEVLSGEGMDICAAFYPAILEKNNVQVWIDEKEVTEITEVTQDFILITKNLEEGYHRVTVKLENQKGMVLEELSWTFYTL